MAKGDSNKMGKAMTALQVKNLPKGAHAVDRGLRIKSKGDGTGEWQARYKWTGKDAAMSLGHYPAVTLADAREALAEIRAKVRRGIDPRKELKEVKVEAVRSAITFREVAEMALEDFKPEWKCGGEKNGFMPKLRLYIYPAIGDKPLSEINGKMLADMVRPLWHTKYPTADKCIKHVNKILGWADAAEYDCDPMAPRRARKLLGKSRHKSTPQKALHWTDVPGHYQSLTHLTMQGLAEAFYLLNATRAGDVVTATWDQISKCGTLWIIPDPKNGREHVAPLSTQAQALLEKADAIYGDKSGYIFKNPHAWKTAHVSYNSWTQNYRRHGIEATSHGARGSFKTWATVNKVEENQIVEECLMHAVRPAQEAVYLRDPLTERRRLVMQAWADLLAGEAASNIVPFKPQAVG